MTKAKHVKMYTAYPAMFFAGLILLIPHRIGMSRVNYVIKRYNLPISRAGLLLYKFHNPIEVSLTIGTLLGNLINWTTGAVQHQSTEHYRDDILKGSIILLLFLMFSSSIYMYRIYITGDDYGYLDHFYFSLILITLFDGFSNAFAFGLNGLYSSMLSAGIPTSGALVSLLHYIYKFISYSFHWDDFDYIVLFLQLLCNIITLLITCILWSVDQGIDMFLISNANSSFATTGDCHTQSTLNDLFTGTIKHDQSISNNDCVHIVRGTGDFFNLFTESDRAPNLSPIGMLAISLGTVYAFYPSIAPYSIIDYQYASVIELWILVISAIPPLLIAILDFNYYGPAGKKSDEQTLITGLGSSNVEVPSGNNKVNFTNPQQTITLTSIQVKHQQKDGAGDVKANSIKHPSNATTACTDGNGDTAFHDWNTDSSKNTISYTLQQDDKYHTGTGQETQISNFTLTTSSITALYYKYYCNWFQHNYPPYSLSISGSKKITFTAGSASAAQHDQVSFTIPGHDPANNVIWSEASGNYYLWNLVWLSAIFYILCIQIFMSMLHYPHCLLSCFFKKHPYAIGLISVLFNTVRETMQACGFSGAGKQSKNLMEDKTSLTGKLIFNDVSLGDGKVTYNSSDTQLTSQDTGKLRISKPTGLTGTYTNQSGQTNQQLTFTDMEATTTNIKLPLHGTNATAHLKIDDKNFCSPVNTTIAATNKLITLFVMMFCVFTGDGYLQHYRRCCRDCWPTTGYNRGQSFFIGYVMVLKVVLNLLLLHLHH